MPDVTNGSFHGKSWRLNTPDANAELLGSEVVAIHLPTGLYYSIENVSGGVWAGIEQGMSFEQLVQVVTSTYTVPREQAEADMAAFLTELAAENLIVETAASEISPEAVAGEKQPYLVPKIEKYPDLQDLLKIDPIHEVGQKGWPQAKPE